MMKKIILLTAATIFTLSSCKKEEKPATPETTQETEQTAPTLEVSEESATPGEGSEITLEIGSTDAMKYTKDELKVSAGATVTLKLTHEGSLSKESMGHNWVLLKKGTDIQSFALDAMNAKDTDYVPANSDAVIAHTSLLGGGESTTITFTAPEAGTYDFICTFPGHYGSMHGKLIVE